MGTSINMNLSNHSNATRTLKRQLGNVVLTDAETLYTVSFDGMKLSFMPEACIRVTDTEQVGKVLKLANKHKVPVTTRGGGSSLTSSAAPFQGGWVLDMRELNAIQIDALEGLAQVQAGAIVGNLQTAALKAGWMYPPDPSSSKYSTLGGNLACNAGGLRGAKYGVTRDYVVALKGYLPTGEFVTWGRPLRKWAVGYNMRDLWIGSEGTLGVITGATLRLVAPPVQKATFLAAFPREETALKAVRSIAEARFVPVALEFLDRETITGLETFTGVQVFAECPGASLLLIEIDGDAGQVEQQRDFLRTQVAPMAKAFREARNAEEAEAFWNVRRKGSPAMFAHGNSKLNEDIVVPLRSQPKLIRLLRQLRKSSGLHIPTFGHAADGNFHVNIMYNREDPKHCQRAQAAVEALMRGIVDMGGAISGEHGIGLAKSKYLPLQIGIAERKAMLAVKQALDPQGILNPGKLFTPYPAWEKTPEAVQLSWDHARKA